MTSEHGSGKSIGGGWVVDLASGRVRRSDEDSGPAAGEPATGAAITCLEPRRRLRVALIAPPWFAVPPSSYGGIERVVAELADGLVERGHDVTLFASGGSVCSGKVVSPFEAPPSADLGDPIVEMRHLLASYRQAAKFDVIHDHTTLGLLAGAMLPEVPVVHTVHGPVSEALAGLMASVPSNVHLVTISGAQQRSLPAGVRSTLIHNGIPVERFPFSATPGKYLLFVGRMSPEKGPLHAIAIAKQAGLPLRMLAKVNEPAEVEYYESRVKPALDEIGAYAEIDLCEQEKQEAYRDALATLFPITWEEPFGLVMIESMAAGTPIIAFRRGSAPEVVEDGCTGFLCDSVDEAAQAATRVVELDRNACRRRVEDHFSSSANVAQHERLYRRLVALRRHTARPFPTNGNGRHLPGGDRELTPAS